MAENNLPGYVADPLQGFLDYWKDSTKLLQMTMQGISVLRAMPRIQQALMKVKDTREDEKENVKLANAKEAAEFANKRVSRGFH
jgi:hypothetical protein